MFNNKGKLTHSLAKTMLFMAFLSFLSLPLHTYAATYDEPYVVTESASNIDNDSARLNGFVDGNGRSTKAWFEYGRDIDMNSATAKISTDSDSDNFSKTISGLRENTVYYFRAVAQNSEGKNYGNIFSLRTGGYRYNDSYYYDQTYYPDYYDSYDNQNYYTYPNYYNTQGSNNSSSPTALTNGATAVSNTSAQLNALITTSVNNNSNAWFEWGTTMNLGNVTTHMSVGSLRAVENVHTLNGLRPGTVYYFRAVAENSYWRNNGAILSFITGGSSSASEVGQNTNTIIIREYLPAPVAPITIIREPAPVEDEDINKDPETVSPSLGANVLGAGTFFPGNIIGWFLLIILVLVLVLLMKHPGINVWDKNKDGHNADSQSHH